VESKQRAGALRAVLAPLQAFFSLEASGSLVLLGATVLALLWANSPWSEAYATLTSLSVALEAFGHHVRVSTETLVNEVLMTLFFFVVGMEIKLERLSGELKQTSQALLPLGAAAGGMLVPAAIYFALNRGGPGAGGWGIPMATDIAFAIGIMRLLGSRVPPALPIFLLALAVFDDIGGIVVIAAFYGKSVKPEGLAAAAIVLAVTLLAARRRVVAGVVYLVLGALLWLALLHAGVHPALAGVGLGLCVPEPVLRRFLDLLHPYVAFAIVPLFALVNAGVPLKGLSLADLLASITLGVLLGLCVGKPVGILAFTWLFHRVAGIRFPSGSSLAQIAALGMVAGIGFTVALFIAQLAFPAGSSLLAQAKLGILLGSAFSAGAGYLGLRALSGSVAVSHEA
jgi:NhaA family Na+:H+ antiporter